MSRSLPDYELKVPNKPINWDRIRSIDIDKFKKKNDVNTLLNLVDDLSLGFIPNEDVDPSLHKAIMISQLCNQYVLSCNATMKSRLKLINKAIDTFQDEEDALETELTRYRAREKALKRENQECDAIISDDTDLLRELDPKLAKKYNRKVKSKSKISIKQPATRRESYTSDDSDTIEVESIDVRGIDAPNAKATEWHSASNAKSRLAHDNETYTAQVQSKAKAHPLYSQNQVKSTTHSKNDVNIEPVPVKPTLIPTKSAYGIRTKPVVVADAKTSRSGQSSDTIASEDFNSSKMPIAIDNTSKSEYSTMNQDGKFAAAKFADSVEIAKNRKMKPLISTIDSRQSKMSYISNDSLDMRDRQVDSDADEKLSEAADSSLRKSPLDMKEMLYDDEELYLSHNDVEDTVYLSDERPSLRTYPASSRSASTDRLAERRDGVSQSQPSWNNAKPKTSSSDLHTGRSNVNNDHSYSSSEAYCSTDSYINSHRHSDQDVSYTQTMSSAASKPTSTAPRNSYKDYDTTESFTESIPSKANHAYEDDVLIGTVSKLRNSSIVSTYSSEIDLESSGELKPSLSPMISKNTGIRLPRTVMVSSTSPSASTSNDQPSSYQRMKSDVQAPSSAVKNNHLRWSDGRASLDLIEIAQAMDVLISSLTINDAFPLNHSYLQFRIDFMDMPSPLSDPIRYDSHHKGGSAESLISINFASHLQFDSESIDTLTREIEKKKEDLSLTITVSGYDEDDNIVAIGFGIVNLWAMVEDSCNIIRHDIELRSLSGSDIIGSMLIDVRGYHLLSLCS